MGLILNSFYISLLMIFDKEIILEDDTTLLRPVEPGDVNGFRKIFCEEDIWDYTVTKYSTDEEIDKFVADAVWNKQNSIRYTFTVIDKISGEIAASSSFGNFAFDDKCVEIGWSYVGKKFWGTHINPHMKYHMLCYAFEEMGMNRVEFKTHDANPRSGRALLKIGCKKEGVLRSKNVLHNGRLRDTAFYSILAGEWPNVKETVFDKLL